MLWVLPVAGRTLKFEVGRWWWVVGKDKYAQPSHVQTLIPNIEYQKPSTFDTVFDMIFDLSKLSVRYSTLVYIVASSDPTNLYI